MAGMEIPAEVALITSVVTEPSGAEEVVVKLSEIPVMEPMDEDTERGMNEDLGLNEQVVVSSGDIATTRETLVYRDRTLNVSYEIQRGSSKRGRDKLIDSLGFTYNCKPVRTSKTITWTCSVRNARLRCPATVLQRGDVFMRGSKKHQHFLGQSVAKPDARLSSARKNAGSQKVDVGIAKVNQDYRIIKHGSKSGMDILRDSLGYTYTFKRTTAGGDKTYWICSVRNKNVRCEATVIQYADGNFIEGPHEHKHLPAYNIPAKDTEEIPSLRKLREEREEAESDMEDMGSSGVDKTVEVQEHSYGSTSNQSSTMGSIYLNSTKMMAKRKTTSLVHEKKRREHETFLGPQCTINLSKCDDADCNCQLVHCPFCDPIHFKPTKAGRVQDHLELTHFAHGVQYDDLMIVKCFKECDIDKNFGHYHCVFCPQQIIKRDFYARHMLRHLRNMGVPEHLLMLPDSKYPDIINAYGYEIPICKKTICSPDRDKHFHCPVCSKVCQQRSLTVNHLWRCFQKQQGNTEDISDGDETELCNTIDEESIIVHFSHAKSVNDLPLDKCTEIDCCNQKYHCILCPEEIFIPSYKQQLVVHYMTHWKHRVPYKNYGLMRCYQDCFGNLKTPNKQKFHYHCPICTKTIQSRITFEDHLRSCHMLRFGENLIQTKNPVNEPADEALPVIDEPVMLQDSIEFLEDQLIAQSKAYSEKKSLERKQRRMEKRNKKRKNSRYFAMFEKPVIKQEVIKKEEKVVQEENVEESDEDEDLSRKIEDKEIFQTCTAVITKRCMKTIWSREDLQSLLGEVAGKTDTNLVFGDDGKYQLTGAVEDLFNAQSLIKQSINKETETSSDEEIYYTSSKKKKIISTMRGRKFAQRSTLKFPSKSAGCKALAKKVLTAAIQKGRGKPSVKQTKAPDTFPYSEIKEIINATKNIQGKNGTPDKEVKDVKQEALHVVRGRGRPRKSEVVVDTNDESQEVKGRGRPRKSEIKETEKHEELTLVPKGRGRPRKSVELESTDTNDEPSALNRMGRPRKSDVLEAPETPNTVKRGRGRPPKNSPARSTEQKLHNKVETGSRSRQNLETKSMNESPATTTTPKRYGTRGLRKDYAGMNSGIGIIEIKEEIQEDNEASYVSISDNKRKRSSITKSPTSNKRQKISDELLEDEPDIEYDSEDEWEPDNKDEPDVEENSAEEVEEDDDYYDEMIDYDDSIEPEIHAESTENDGQVKDGDKQDDLVQDEIDYKAELDDIEDKSDGKVTEEQVENNEDDPVKNSDTVQNSTESIITDEVAVDSDMGRTVYVPLTGKMDQSMKVENDSSQIISTPVELSREITHVSKPALKLQCSYCDKQFAFKSNLDDHENKHTGVTPYKCEICAKGFPSQSLLMKHKTLVHTSMRPFKCSVCHRSFRFMNVLQSHMATHSKTKYQCKTCNKTFSNQSAQKYHMGYCGINNTTGTTSVGSEMEKLIIYTNRGPTEVINTIGNNFTIMEETVAVSQPSTIGQSYEIPRNTEPLIENIAMNEQVSNIEVSNIEVSDNAEAVEQIELYACSECNSTFDTLAKAESHIVTAHPVVIVM